MMLLGCLGTGLRDGAKKWRINASLGFASRQRLCGGHSLGPGWPTSLCFVVVDGGKERTLLKRARDIITRHPQPPPPLFFLYKKYKNHHRSWDDGQQHSQEYNRRAYNWGSRSTSKSNNIHNQAAAGRRGVPASRDSSPSLSWSSSSPLICVWWLSFSILLLVYLLEDSRCALDMLAVCWCCRPVVLIH